MRGRGSSKEASRELPTIRLLLQEDRRLDARLFSRFSSRLRAGRESSISSSKMESRDSARSKWLSPIDSVIVVPYDCCALLVLRTRPSWDARLGPFSLPRCVRRSRQFDLFNLPRIFANRKSEKLKRKYRPNGILSFAIAICLPEAAREERWRVRACSCFRRTQITPWWACLPRSSMPRRSSSPFRTPGCSCMRYVI